MDKAYKTEEIYEIMKDRVIHLEYEPGLVLNEEEVAEEFNVSRTPIRKVFQQLNADNLLNIIPRYGAQVTPVDFRRMKSIFEVTRQLDPFAARLAVERIQPQQIATLEEILDRLKSYRIPEDYQKAIDDDEIFHKTILESSGNTALAEILARLHMQTERMWHYSEQYIDSINIFTDTLGGLLEAIKERDIEKAERYSREHIDEFVEKIKKEML
jgi:DNA-binding GntR family transcriptional regulator